MGWISKYLRKATPRSTASRPEAPIDNGAGIDYRDVYNAIGWDVTIDVSDSNMTEASGESWSDAEMRDAGGATPRSRPRVALPPDLRAPARLDDARDHVRRLRRRLEQHPARGAGISSHWTIPNEAVWGTVRGMRFGTAVAPYFRTAIHEIGHAMGCTTTRSTTASCIRRRTSRRTPCRPAVPGQHPLVVLARRPEAPAPPARHLGAPGRIAFGTDYSTSPISPTDSVEDAEGSRSR